MQDAEELDRVDQQISEYEATLASTKFHCPLKFWKTYNNIIPSLGQLAKKYLGVPASAANVERMFSIAGHIISIKRRRMCVSLFVMLVMLKLNESIMMKFNDLF